MQWYISIIYSDQREDHILLDIIVVKRLTENNLPINVDKSRFGQDIVHLLGFLISGAGIEMDNEKGEATKNFRCKNKTSNR